MQPTVQKLLDRGVVLPCPFSVEVDLSVNPERIAPGVILHTGCRISGAKTSIGPGSELGREAPVTIEDCQLGHKVELKGGSFSGATFLDGANMGSAAHVRPGTLLEEEAGAAHAVGLQADHFSLLCDCGESYQFLRCLDGGRNQPEKSQRDRFVLYPFQFHAAPGQGDTLADWRCAPRRLPGSRRRSSWEDRADWSDRRGLPTAP